MTTGDYPVRVMPFPTKTYGVIYVDPPWDIGKFGKGRDMRKGRIYKIGSTIPVPYLVMSDNDILKMPVESIADERSHLWLWATNRSLRVAFEVMEKWGFKYLNTITFIKPSGIGAWFINTTQHLLFGYRGKLEMGEGRYKKTDQYWTPKKHSTKPEYVYDLIKSVSPYENRIELFARNRQFGWDSWGNEI